MDQWHYQMLVVDMGGTGSQLGFVRSSISKMWEVMGPDGLSDWDRLQTMGKDGWELVSSMPISAGNGNTVQVVFTFKRKASAQMPVQAAQQTSQPPS